MRHFYISKLAAFLLSFSVFLRIQLIRNLPLFLAKDVSKAQPVEP